MAGIIEIATALRKLILELDPKSVEVIYLGYNSSSFGVGPKKNSEAYAYVMPHTKHVNLGFYFGAALPDPHNLLEGAGKNLRHIKIKTLEMVSDPAVSELISASIAERQAFFNL